ncbi:MAG: chemotaxis protein CheA [Desulfovibrionaceae bacterium]|nr:chemotaxis protein CheA [Desulfovibrionaceae bacterium]MBF0514309.1 chemotaxis protein CheA [Desulfovibrionaceae bacterium]
MSHDEMHRAAFLEEAAELLGELEEALLELESRPQDADLVNRVFRAMHTLKGSGAMFGFEDVAAFAHEVETVFDKVRCGLITVGKELLDLNLAARDHVKHLLECARQGTPPDTDKGDAILAGLARISPPKAPPPEREGAGAGLPEIPAIPEEPKKLGEILLEKGDLDPQALSAALAGQKRLGQVLVEAGLVASEKVEAALAEQTLARELRDAREQKDKGEQKQGEASIRVAAEKLDWLVNLVGELVIVQSQISQIGAGSGNAAFVSLAEQLERLSGELRDSTLGIRMLPIGATFNKFRRLVRDLSAELGKEIELVTRGEETELDKTVIERISDPLVHLLRNAIDHGVETPAERLALGKDAKGTIELTAEHEGSEVVIRVKDDGAGIDPAKVRAKAVERGLIAQHDGLSRNEILGLIFAPGFSTADKVSSVSGRGVGMDVVKRAIEALRGQVEIDSAPGQGSVVAIRLPLTLAIIDGLQVLAGDEYYVLPLSLVEECVELARDAGDAESGKQIVNLRGKIVSYVRLRDCFAIPGEPPAIEQLIVVSSEGRRVGLVVDHVIGEHQTVIKSLGPLYRDLPGLAGATVRGDGRMALIVDISGLLKSVDRPGS